MPSNIFTETDEISQVLVVGEQSLTGDTSRDLRRDRPPLSACPNFSPSGNTTGGRLSLFPAASRASVTQGLAALQHAAEDDLHAGRRTQPADPAVLVLALDVARLILVSARAASGLLQGEEGPGVRESHPGLEIPVEPEKP